MTALQILTSMPHSHSETKGDSVRPGKYAAVVIDVVRNFVLNVTAVMHLTLHKRNKDTFFSHVVPQKSLYI